MLRNIEKLSDLYMLRGVRVEIFEGILWVEYNRMVVPAGPVKCNYLISKEKARLLLSRFPNALMVRYTDGFGNADYCKDWYAVICDEFQDLHELSANTRSKIRRGLKNCAVERVDAKFIAEHGYGVFMSAFQRYQNMKKPALTETAFKKTVLVAQDFDDIVHYWGAFYKNQLIAYMGNYIYENIEANYAVMKFHPDFLKIYSSYALLYEMNKYYLKEKQFQYVNDGFRNILHQTYIQNFLIDKFKFKKAHTNFFVVYKPYLSIFSSVTFPLRKLTRGIHPKLGALYELEEIRRKCQNGLR